MSHTRALQQGRKRENRIEKVPVGVITQSLIEPPASSPSDSICPSIGTTGFLERSRACAEQNESARWRVVPAKEATSEAPLTSIFGTSKGSRLVAQARLKFRPYFHVENDSSVMMAGLRPGHHVFRSLRKDPDARRKATPGLQASARRGWPALQSSVAVSPRQTWPASGASAAWRRPAFSNLPD